MRDFDLIKLFRPIIVNGLIAAEFTNIDVVQAYQPVQEGINKTATVYFYKVMDYPYGWPSKTDEYDSVNQVNIHTETQQYETTFQIFALQTLIPEDVDGFTASDLINQVAAILRNDSTIETLEAQGVGIYKINNVRNMPFLDDRERYEYQAIFDFTLTHKQVTVSRTPVAQSVEFGIFRI